MSEYTKFNEVAIEFLTRMKNAFPDEKKISTYLDKFVLVKSANFKLPVEIFMENLEPYGLQIMSKNEQFFHQDQYVNMAESMSGKIGLIHHWKVISEETKNNIWTYMQTLYVLGMNVLNKREDLRKILMQIR